MPEPRLFTEPQGTARFRSSLEKLPPPVHLAVERGRRLVAEPLRGVTTDGTVVPGLFPIAHTGISTRPIRAAAEAFAACLDAQQRAEMMFPVDSVEWRNWHNMHPNLFRHGVCLFELSDEQRERALDMLRATLSAAGYQTMRDIMRLNHHVLELTGRAAEFNEWYYFVSVFGTPSESEPWGWQFDGHHLAVNCFVLGDQLVVSPQFAGSEPVFAEYGRYAGVHVFGDEEARGLALMRALDAEQQRRAVVGEVIPRDALGTAHADNLVLPYAGIPAGALSDAQRSLLLDTLAVYVERIRPGHAAVRMDEVKRHLNETHFAWIGGTGDVSPFYYRIHSPVVMIEFDHLPGVIWDNPEPTRKHIHTVVRTPNGNDYGADLLRRHYHEHDHSDHDPHRHGRR